MSDVSEPIRPVLKVFAAGVVLAVALVTYLALGGVSSVSTRPAQEASAERREPRSQRRVHRSHTSASGPLLHDPSAARPADEAAPSDPQWEAYLRSYQRFGDAGVGASFGPMRRAARVSGVEGDAPVPPGAVCDVRVLPVASRRFNCLLRVTCDEVVLYPDAEQHAGYAPCELGPDYLPRRALDEGVTGSDGDPAIDLDLETGRATVREEGAATYSVSLDIG